ncbi:MAG: hypothetical protein V1728_06415 [Candidatus Micrarchaeota archaeon]
MSFNLQTMMPEARNARERNVWKKNDCLVMTGSSSTARILKGFNPTREGLKGAIALASEKNARIYVCTPLNSDLNSNLGSEKKPGLRGTYVWVFVPQDETFRDIGYAPGEL